LSAMNALPPLEGQGENTPLLLSVKRRRQEARATTTSAL
jgi:hypothetical protein